MNDHLTSCPHGVRHPHPCRECEDAGPTSTEVSELLARLDRVGVHNSVTARYCKEAALMIRALVASNAWR